jgi:hypothetical protein
MAFTSSVANDDVKRGSLSDIIRPGSPNHLYTLSKYNRAISAPVMVVLHGRNRAALVQPWSTMVRIASWPLLSGSWVIRSRAITSNGWAATGTGIRYSGVVLFGRFLFCWQTAHPSMYFRIQLFIPVQLWCLFTNAIVLSLPGWPAVGSSWYRIRISRLSSSDNRACLTNSLSGRTTTSWLSSVPMSAPGGLDSMSAAAWIFPGTCFITKL